MILRNSFLTTLATLINFSSCISTPKPTCSVKNKYCFLEIIASIPNEVDKVLSKHGIHSVLIAHVNEAIDVYWTEMEGEKGRLLNPKNVNENIIPAEILFHFYVLGNSTWADKARRQMDKDIGNRTFVHEKLGVTELLDTIDKTLSNDDEDYQSFQSIISAFNNFLNQNINSYDDFLTPIFKNLNIITGVKAVIDVQLSNMRDRYRPSRFPVLDGDWQRNIDQIDMWSLQYFQIFKALSEGLTENSAIKFINEQVAAYEDLLKYVLKTANVRVDECQLGQGTTSDLPSRLKRMSKSPPTFDLFFPNHKSFEFINSISISDPELYDYNYNYITETLNNERFSVNLIEFIYSLNQSYQIPIYHLGDIFSKYVTLSDGFILTKFYNSLEDISELHISFNKELDMLDANINNLISESMSKLKSMNMMKRNDVYLTFYRIIHNFRHAINDHVGQEFTQVLDLEILLKISHRIICEIKRFTASEVFSNAIQVLTSVSNRIGSLSYAEFKDKIQSAFSEDASDVDDFMMSEISKNETASTKHPNYFGPYGPCGPYGCRRGGKTKRSLIINQMKIDENRHPVDFFLPTSDTKQICQCQDGQDRKNFRSVRTVRLAYEDIRGKKSTCEGYQIFSFDICLTTTEIILSGLGCLVVICLIVGVLCCFGVCKREKSEE